MRPYEAAQDIVLSMERQGFVFKQTGEDAWELCGRWPPTSHDAQRLDQNGADVKQFLNLRNSIHAVMFYMPPSLRLQ